jgi:hypothetical protein
VQSHLVHQLIHDECCSGHISGVFHQRDEEIEYFKNHEKLIEQFENEVIALKLRIQELEQKLEVEDNQSQT